MNYFHTGFYYFNDLIFGKIYIFIIEITMSHVIILDLNVFQTKKGKRIMIILVICLLSSNMINIIFLYILII